MKAVKVISLALLFVSLWVLGCFGANLYEVKFYCFIFVRF